MEATLASRSRCVRVAAYGRASFRKWQKEPWMPGTGTVGPIRFSQDASLIASKPVILRENRAFRARYPSQTPAGRTAQQDRSGR